MGDSVCHRLDSQAVEVGIQIAPVVHDFAIVAVVGHDDVFSPPLIERGSVALDVRRCLADG